MAKDSVKIGLKNVFYAPMDETNDTPAYVNADGTATALLYGPCVRLSGGITANFDFAASNDTLYADDGPYEVASTFGAATLELNLAALAIEDQAALLGSATNSTNDALVITSSDTPPWVAVGWSTKKSNGSTRLTWYLKGKFTVPADNSQTKADSINWNTPTITGNFAARACDGAMYFGLDNPKGATYGTTLQNWFANSTAGALIPSIRAASNAATATALKTVTTTLPTGYTANAEATIDE